MGKFTGFLLVLTSLIFCYLLIGAVMYFYAGGITWRSMAIFFVTWSMCSFYLSFKRYIYNKIRNQ